MKEKKSPKYKYTKQILKLAHQDGMGYSDIAVKAGLSANSKSLVNTWIKGSKLATERQMQFFINAYGASLKRKMEHLFYNCFKTLKITEQLIEQLEKHRISITVCAPNKENEKPDEYNLLDISAEQRKCLLDGRLDIETSNAIIEKVYKLDEYERELFFQKISESYYPYYFKVNGEVILKQSLYLQANTNDKHSRRVAMKRILLIHASDKFHFIIQTRLSNKRSEVIRSTNEDAPWSSICHKNLDFSRALAHIDLYACNLNKDFSDGSITLPFIARQALLKQGFCAPDINDVIDPTSDSEIITEPPKG